MTYIKEVSYTKWFKTLNPRQKMNFKDHVLKQCKKNGIELSEKEVENFNEGMLPGVELGKAINEVLKTNFVYGKVKNN